MKIKREEGRASSVGTRKKMKIEQGGTSNARIKNKTFCKICMEAYPSAHIFLITSCSHAFCRDCLRSYISTRIEENISAIKCPEEKCNGMLEPEACQGIIPKEVFERWGRALCESMVLAMDKYTYCPFKDCNALLLVDEGDNVIEAECPNCRRMFCASCGVTWHSGLSCEEVKKLGDDERGGEDLKLAKLAKSYKWKRCPKCRYYVEKTEGCLHITCRCKFQFCYRCGKKWSDCAHGSCGGA